MSLCVGMAESEGGGELVKCPERGHESILVIG